MHWRVQDMMRKTAALVAVVALILVGGCTNPIVQANKGDGGGILFLESQHYGWVEMRVESPGTIHWGDSFDVDAYTEAAGPGLYKHLYGSPGVYAARLLDREYELAELTIQVPTVRGHVELIAVDGLTITVRHYAADEEFDRSEGFAERTYWIEWGDGEATTITSHEYYALGRDRPHTYARPGTYSIGVRSPGQGTTPSFTVTVRE